jgi:hypothetical protein
MHYHTQARVNKQFERRRLRLAAENLRRVGRRFISTGSWTTISSKGIDDGQIVVKKPSANEKLNQEISGDFSVVFSSAGDLLGPPNVNSGERRRGNKRINVLDVRSLKVIMDGRNSGSLR